MASEQAMLNVMGRALWDPHPTRTDLRARQLAAALGYPTSWRVVRTVEKQQQDFNSKPAEVVTGSSSNANANAVENVNNKSDNNIKSNDNNKDCSSQAQAAAATKAETKTLDAASSVSATVEDSSKSKSDDIIVMEDLSSTKDEKAQVQAAEDAATKKITETASTSTEKVAAVAVAMTAGTIHNNTEVKDAIIKPLVANEPPPPTKSAEESTAGNDNDKIAAAGVVVDRSSSSNMDVKKKEATQPQSKAAEEEKGAITSVAIDNNANKGAPVVAASSSSSSNPKLQDEASTIPTATVVEKATPTDEATKLEEEEETTAMDIDDDDKKAAMTTTTATTTTATTAVVEKTTNEATAKTATTAMDIDGDKKSVTTAAATESIISNGDNKDAMDDKKDATVVKTADATPVKKESPENANDDDKKVAAVETTSTSSNPTAQATTTAFVATTSTQQETATKPTTTFAIVDRIYAGKPGTECDMWFNHYAAMQAAQVWYEKDEQQLAAQDKNTTTMPTSTNTPFQFKGGHMLPRQSKFNTGDKVEVYMEDAWWDAKILRKKEHAEHGFRYQVHYAVDSTKQSGIDESLIRPRSAEKDPLAVAARLGFPEAWQAVSTGHNRWKITSPDGVVYQSKKAALKAAKEEATVPAAAAADVGDPPWRTTGHALIGRTVLYSQEHAVSSRRKVTVEQIGKVVGWISETDVDKAGEPGFLSEQTGKPANLFHVKFEDSSQNHPYPGFLVESQDLEEFEVETILIPEEDLQPAKKKARKR